MASFSNIAVAALIALATTPAGAQVHRCTAADGKVSFSDTVCSGERAQKTFGIHSSASGWAVESPRPPAPRTAAGAAGKPTLSTPPR